MQSDILENVETQLKKGSLELCILSLLAKKRWYGYELVIELSQSGLLVTEGTLYPILLRLATNKYLTSYWEESEQGRQRKYYDITSQGKEALDRLKKQWKGYINKVNLIIE